MFFLIVKLHPLIDEIDRKVQSYIRFVSAEQRISVVYFGNKII